MAVQPDILLYSPERRLEAVVEVKTKTGAGEQWAAHFRRNLLLHSQIPASAYFLLVFPDYLYLWHDSEEEGPRFKVATQDALGPFFRALPEEPVDERDFELVVASWLGTLTDPGLAPEEAVKVAGWLVESGLYDRIRGGHVEYHAAA